MARALGALDDITQDATNAFASLCRQEFSIYAR